MTKLPNLLFERRFFGKIVAGIDESGRGSFAGPVVAAAVILDQNNIPVGINDSKKLSSLKKERLYKEITSNHLYSIGIGEVHEIDRYNILEATKLAMVRAFDNLRITPEVALIDGNTLPEIRCEKLAIIKGDSLSLSIAAASIIAKVTRDKIMTELDKIYPSYKWIKNFGYGTVLHKEAMKQHGITEIHRKSFSFKKKNSTCLTN